MSTSGANINSSAAVIRRTPSLSNFISRPPQAIRRSWQVSSVLFLGAVVAEQLRAVAQVVGLDLGVLVPKLALGALGHAVQAIRAAGLRPVAGVDHGTAPPLGRHPELLIALGALLDHCLFHPF